MLSRDVDGRNTFSVESTPKANAIPIVTAPSEIHATNQRLIKKRSTSSLLGGGSKIIANKLSGGGARRQATNTYPHKVAIFAILLHPIRNLLFVRQRTLSGIDPDPDPAPLMPRHNPRKLPQRPR